MSSIEAIRPTGPTSGSSSRSTSRGGYPLLCGSPASMLAPNSTSARSADWSSGTGIRSTTDVALSIESPPGNLTIPAAWSAPRA